MRRLQPQSVRTATRAGAHETALERACAHKNAPARTPPGRCRTTGGAPFVPRPVVQHAWQVYAPAQHEALRLYAQVGAQKSLA
jgi:hypothetical protein